MFRLKLIVILITVFISLSCQGNKSFDSIPFSPDFKDGVYFVSFKDNSNENIFSGDWGAPVMEKSGSFSRHLLNGTGKLRFFLPKVEKYILTTNFLNSTEDLEVKLNGKRLRFKGEKIFISRNLVRIGENILSFSTGKELIVHEVGFFPSRLLRIRNFKNIFGKGNTLFLPGSLNFYIKPIGEEYISIKFENIEKRDLKFEINFFGPTGVIKKEKVNCSGNEYLKIVPEKGIFQKIELRPVSLKNGFLKVLDSSLIRRAKQSENNKKDIEEIKKIVKGKNLLFVLLDATRRDHVGYQGYKRGTTPNIDSISKDSQIFKNCYSEASFTLASTGTLLTGIAPDFHGVVSKFYSSLNRGTFTLGDMFSEIGYFTAAISGNPNFGKAYRYDKGFKNFLELFEDHPVVIAEEFLSPFEKMLQKIKNSPFFIYLHIREPHDPFYMPTPFLGKFQSVFRSNDQSLKKFGGIFHNSYTKEEDDISLLRDIYDENLAYGDMVFGKIVEILKKRNLFSKTVIVFLADHGEAIGEHGVIGHGHVLYQEGINIPMLMRIPGLEKREFSSLSITSDLVRTLTDLFNLNFRYLNISYGKNLFSIPTERRVVTRSINVFNYPSYTVIQYPYKLIVNFPIIDENIRLFNLENDPHEMMPLNDNLMKKRSLLFYLFNHLKNAKKFKNKIIKPKLKESDLKSLKSLGYIQ